MAETHKIFDPFIGQTVTISSRLTDRLRGRYANGPTLENGEPEFGWRQFPSSPIQIEAANEIERLRRGIADYLHGDYPRTAKNDKCKHDRYGFEGCENCIDDYFEKLLGEE